MIYISFFREKVIRRVSAPMFWNVSRADVNLSSPSAAALFPFRTSCSRTQTRDTASSSLLHSTISRLCKPSICCYGILLKKRKQNKNKDRRGRLRESSQAAHLPFAISIWLWGFEYFWWFFFFLFCSSSLLHAKTHLWINRRCDEIYYYTDVRCEKNPQYF